MLHILMFDQSGLAADLLKRDLHQENTCLMQVQENLAERATSTDEFFHLACEAKIWQRVGRSGTHTLTNVLTAIGTNDNLLVVINTVLRTAPDMQEAQSGVEILKHLRLTQDLNTLLRETHVVMLGARPLLDCLRQKPNNTILLSDAVSYLELPREREALFDIASLAELSLKKLSFVSSLIPFVRSDYETPDVNHMYSNWWGVRKLIDAARISMPLVKFRYPRTVSDSLHALEDKKALFLFQGVSAEPSANPITPPLLGRNRLQLVYVEDETGWREAVPSILAAASRDRWQVKALPIPARAELDVDWVDHDVLSSRGAKPALVLLDLRLRGAAEAHLAVKDTSGAQVLRCIRNLDPGVPVILMTASNKARTLEEAMKLGADGYWMKEGLGEHAPENGSQQNFIRLLSLIETALGEDYQYLRRFAEGVARIEAMVEPWWLVLSPNTPLDGPGEINDGLAALVNMLREYLRLFVMGQGYGADARHASRPWLSAMIIEALKLVETIYRRDLEDDRLALGALLAAKNDYWGVKLNSTRPRAAHHLRDSHHLDFQQVRQVLAGLLAWLSVAPEARSTKHFLNHPIYTAINQST